MMVCMMAQAALQEQAQDSMQSMHSVGSQGLSWVPVMHPGAQPGGVPSLLQPPSSQQARDAVSPHSALLKILHLMPVLEGQLQFEQCQCGSIGVTCWDSMCMTVNGACSMHHRS